MVTICENFKAISQELSEIYHKQSLSKTQMWMDDDRQMDTNSNLGNGK